MPAKASVLAPDANTVSLGGAHRVPNQDKLADRLQLALSQLGDGFFALKGTTLVGGIERNLKDLNGEVISGTGLQVLVRDFVALIDGIVLTDKNKAQFTPTNTTAVTLPGVGVHHLVMSAPRNVGSDGFNRPDSDRGVIEVSATLPGPDSGKILVARVIIPTGTTQITADMIDNSVKDFLQDLDKETLERKISDRTLANQIASGLAGTENTIRIAQTNFKVDTLLQVQTNDLKDGWVEAYVSDADVDTALSSDQKHDPGLDKMVVDAGVVVSPADLTHYLKMDEGIKAPLSTALLDSSGNDWNGTIFNGRFVPGILGTGVESNPNLPNFSFIYDGLAPDPHVALSPGIGDFTLSIWVRLTPGSKPHTLFNRQAVARPADVMPFLLDAATRPELETNHRLTLFMAERFQFGVPLGKFEVVSADTGDLRDGAYHHIAAVRDASTPPFLFLYVDGELAINRSGFRPEGQGPVNIVWDDNKILFQDVLTWINDDGSVRAFDEDAYLKRALTAAEITAIFNAGIGNPFGGGATSATIISKAHTTPATNNTVLLTWDGSDDLIMAASRDNGTTFTVVAKDTPTDISAQPAGTQMRFKAQLPTATSELDNAAMFWK